MDESIDASELQSCMHECCCVWIAVLWYVVAVGWGGLEARAAIRGRSDPELPILVLCALEGHDICQALRSDPDTVRLLHHGGDSRLQPCGEELTAGRPINSKHFRNQVSTTKNSQRQQSSASISSFLPGCLEFCGKRD